MKGTPVSQLDGKLGELLTSFNESLSYDYDTPIRCDQCSEVIHPNQPCSVLFADRYLTEPETQQQFRLTRIECEDCTPSKLYYDAPGYSELLLMGKFDPSYTLKDLHLLGKSSRSEGLDWNPLELKRILDPKNQALSNLSPSDFMRVIALNLDPRDIVDPISGELLIQPHEEETFALLFALQSTKGEHTKDQLRALKQSMDGDVTEEDTERYMKHLESELQSIFRDEFL